MKITVEIECDDWNDLRGHIQVIRKQLKKRVLAWEDTPESSTPNAAPPQEFQDNNCYGTHEVKIDFE